MLNNNNLWFVYRNGAYTKPTLLLSISFVPTLALRGKQERERFLSSLQVEKLSVKYGRLFRGPKLSCGVRNNIYPVPSNITFHGPIQGITQDLLEMPIPRPYSENLLSNRLEVWSWKLHFFKSSQSDSMDQLWHETVSSSWAGTSVSVWFNRECTSIRWMCESMHDHRASVFPGKPEINSGLWALGSGVKVIKAERESLNHVKCGIILCTWYVGETVLGAGNQRRVPSCQPDREISCIHSYVG